MKKRILSLMLVLALLLAVLPGASAAEDTGDIFFGPAYLNDHLVRSDYGTSFWYYFKLAPRDDETVSVTVSAKVYRGTEPTGEPMFSEWKDYVNISGYRDDRIGFAPKDLQPGEYVLELSLLVQHQQVRSQLYHFTVTDARPDYQGMFVYDPQTGEDVSTFCVPKGFDGPVNYFGRYEPDEGFACFYSPNLWYSDVEGKDVSVKRFGPGMWFHAETCGTYAISVSSIEDFPCFIFAEVCTDGAGHTASAEDPAVCGKCGSSMEKSCPLESAHRWKTKEITGDTEIRVCTQCGKESRETIYVPRNGQCGENVTWSFDRDNGTLTISGTGDMYDFISAEAPWQPFDTEIQRVVIDEGITSIGDYAFLSCDQMLYVTIPETVETIGRGAFGYCYLLHRMTIPASVKEIRPAAFIGAGVSAFTVAEGNTAYCTDEHGVLFTKDMTTLLQYPNNAHGEYTIPKGVTEIAQQAFYMCSRLEYVTVPEGVTSIAPLTFSRSGLREVTLPDSLVTIGEEAFSCDFLYTVHLGRGLKTVEDAAFGVCSNLQNVTYNGMAGMWKGISIGKNNEPLLRAKRTCAFDIADVSSKSYYCDAVLWALENNVTNGTSYTTFSPKQECSRAQVVTFLWRASNYPDPESFASDFTDVKDKDYFYYAVLWAVEEGITNGMSPTLFGTKSPCTRAQIVTFLWRFAGEPEPTTTHNPFTDVAEDAYYAKAVLWAVENGITNGMSETLFAPNRTCDRGQVVTFLYRLVHMPV